MGVWENRIKLTSEYQENAMELYSQFLMGGYHLRTFAGRNSLMNTSKKSFEREG